MTLMTTLADAITSIETRRNSRVFVLAASHLDVELLPILYDLITHMGKIPRLDMLLHCSGGEIGAARRIGLMLQQSTERLGIIVPAILKNFGDVPDLAALIAPRRVLIAGGVRGNGQELQTPELRDNYIRAQNAYALSSASGRFQVAQSRPGALAAFLAE